jgi:hypothetical protein
VVIPAVLLIRKARNDYIIANKKVSRARKAAINRVRNESIFEGASILAIAVLLFASEIFGPKAPTRDQLKEDMRTVLREEANKVEASRFEEFQQKYPNGHTLFSVSGTFVSEEMRKWDTNVFKADWDTASVQSLTPTNVVFVPPAFRVGPGALKVDGLLSLRGDETNFTINFGGGTATEFQRRTGDVRKWATIGLGIDSSLNVSTNLKVLLEVATNNQFGVTMLIGTKIVVEPVGARTGGWPFVLRKQ